MTERPTLAVGLMSGTSLDGMDAALVRFHGPMNAELLGFVSRPYRPLEREGLENLLRSGGAQEYATLHVTIAEWAAQTVHQLLTETRTQAAELDFIAFPGQTIWHQPPIVTWQLGEPAVLAEAFGVRVVSSFRARDLAAGGEGAPLVPMADILLFGDRDHPRVLLNLGGMANLTFVPLAGEEHGAIAFDTGPGVAVIDLLARYADSSLPYDVDGRLAAQGVVDELVLAELLANPFFDTPPPRSTGREHFGGDFSRRLAARLPGPDGVATAVALTARSIALAISRWVPPAKEILVSGGGRRHPVLMQQLAAELKSCDCGAGLELFDNRYFSGDAKEAVAFALLGYLTIHGQPGNLPAATGARGPRVLGAITPG